MPDIPKEASTKRVARAMASSNSMVQFLRVDRTVFSCEIQTAEMDHIPALVTILLSSFAIVYSYAALIAPYHHLGALNFSPSRTIFVIGLLSQTIALLLEHVFDNVFNVLRWQLASRSNGDRTTTFLALNIATSHPGVLMLICVGGPHLIWCLQRYFSKCDYVYESVHGR